LAPIISTKKKKPGPDWSGVKGRIIYFSTLFFLCINITRHWLMGHNLGYRIRDQLELNLKFAEKDKIPHALEIGKDSEDFAVLKQVTNGKRVMKPNLVKGVGNAFS